MLGDLPTNVSKVCVHTGNILSINELKKKAGQTPTDELIESLKITVSSWKSSDAPGETVQVYRNDDDLQKKMAAEDRKELKISVKVFINTLQADALHDSLKNVLSALETDSFDSLVLAYAPGTSETSDRLSELKQLWEVLEEYVANQKITSIGVSDVDTDVFIALHNWAKVKPSIVQINLATCCVVPPALQEFTKEHDVQLLTHSDPSELLPRESLSDVFGSSQPPFDVFWTLRFQVHVKCRGVLSSKGYIICVRRALPHEDLARRPHVT